MSSIITPESILSYPHLFEPQSAKGDSNPPKFSCTFVFPEGTDLDDLKKAAVGLAKERWDAKLGKAKLTTLETQYGPATFLVGGSLRLRMPWRDDADHIAQKGYPEGSAYVTARSRAESPPGVVSAIPDPSNDGKPARIVSTSGDVRYRDGTVLTAARPVYAGVIGRGLLSVFTYDNNGNTGVGLGLNGVQVIRDGERLDGRKRAEDVFEADSETAVDLSDLTGGAEEDDLSDLIG